MQQPTLSALPPFDEIASFQNEICFENICRSFLYNEWIWCVAQLQRQMVAPLLRAAFWLPHLHLFLFLFFLKAFQCSCTHPDSNDTFSTEVTFCAYNTNIQILQSHDSVLQSPTLEWAIKLVGPGCGQVLFMTPHLTLHALRIDCCKASLAITPRSSYSFSLLFNLDWRSPRD